MRDKVLAVFVTLAMLGSMLTIGAVGVGADTPTSISGGTLVDTDPVTELVVPFIAGQHYISGDIIVWNDLDNIYVLFKTTDGWTMSKTHLYVGLSAPTSSAPGQFPYKHETLAAGSTSDLYTIPFSDLAVPWDDSYTIYIAAHANVAKTVGGSTQTESAWSDGTPFGNNWAMYFEFDPCFGTTLSISKTVDVCYKNTVTYEWALDKYADVTSAELGVGSSLDVHYTIEVTRDVVTSELTIKISGVITVTNTGHLATEGLKVYDEVQALVDGNWVVVTGTYQSLPVSAQIAAGSSATFDYTTVEFAPVEGAEAYRNVAEAMITNYASHSGENYGKQTRVACDLPSEPTVVEINGQAVLGDAFTSVPTPGFTVTGTTLAPVTINSANLDETGKYVATFTVKVTNNAANTLNTYYLDNTATLTPCASAALTDEWHVIITTPFYAGYVYTIGYWKNHAGLGNGNQADVVTQYLPLWLGTAGGSKSVKVTSNSQAVQILSMSGGASNGIVKLKAQLLAAKLNMAGGASNTISSTVTAADSFLATHLESSWSSLSKAEQKQVLGWMSILDQYNNGLLGPLHGN